MRIGIDARCLRGKVGGVRSYTIALSSALIALGHEVTLFSDDTSLRVDRPLKTVTSSSRIGPIKYRGMWEQAVLPLMAKRAGVEVLHFPADVGVSGLKTCPFVATIHDVYPFAMPEIYGEKQVERLRNELRTTAKRADAFMTDSEQSMSDLVNHLGIPESAVTVIPLAPRDCFMPITDGDELEKQRIETGLPERFLLCVGGKNNKRHKNVRGVLEALRILSNKEGFGDVGLVVVGKDSEYMQEVGRLASDSGIGDRIIFTGVIDDKKLCVLYNLASVFAFPSLYEGFGLPALEAMACGTPVVTSNYGAMKEVAGDAAIMIDPLDSGEIAEACGKLLSDDDYRSGVAVKCLARARTFTWQKTAEKTLEVYASVLR